MNKFLTLIEQFDPRNTGSPKWELYEFLKSKGIKVGMVRDTDMLYIDTGSKQIAVTISSNEEESQESDITDDVSKEAGNKLQPQAAQQINRRNRLAPKAINKTKQQLDAVEKSLRTPTNVIR